MCIYGGIFKIIQNSQLKKKQNKLKKNYEILNIIKFKKNEVMELNKIMRN